LITQFRLKDQNTPGSRLGPSQVQCSKEVATRGAIKLKPHCFFFFLFFEMGTLTLLMLPKIESIIKVSLKKGASLKKRGGNQKKINIF